MARRSALRGVLLLALAAATSAQSLDGSSATASPAPSPPPAVWVDTTNSSAAPNGEVRDADTPLPGGDINDGRVGSAGVVRDSGIDTMAIVGISAGCVATVALVVFVVRTRSAWRAAAAQEEQLEQHLAHPQDLAASTMSLKSVKFVESFDSGADSPATLSRKPPTSRKTPAGAQPSSSVFRFSSSSSGRQQQRPPQAAPNTTTDTSLDFSIEEVFVPHSRNRTQSLARSQQSAGGHSVSLQKGTALSPESSVKLGHSNSRMNPFRQVRQARDSRAIEDDVYAASPASPARPSQLRCSGSSIQSTDSADVPMLDEGGDHLARSSQRRHDATGAGEPGARDNDRESTRDIPVLARGSEESVDSVEEDEDVEISI